MFQSFRICTSAPDLSSARQPHRLHATTPMPGFQYKVLSAMAPPVVPNPDTGAIVPGQLITKSYRLEGNIVRRLLTPGEVAPDEAHPDPEQEKAKDAKKAKGKRRR